MIKGFGGAFIVASVLALAPVLTEAEQESTDPNAVPIATVLSSVAKRSGKKFIVDPQVRGDVVLLERNFASLTYEDLLMLLQVNGFTAVTNGDYVRVVPLAAVRQLALPMATDDRHPLAEYVTKIVPVKNMPAPLLVPTLRPLIPQQGHMVAMPCTNDLLIVDTFGNIQRLEKIIRSLDRGEPHRPGKCTMPEPKPQG
jgi:general secretion pathway protein D